MSGKGSLRLELCKCILLTICIPLKHNYNISTPHAQRNPGYLLGHYPGTELATPLHFPCVRVSCSLKGYVRLG